MANLPIEPPVQTRRLYPAPSSPRRRPTRLRPWAPSIIGSMLCRPARSSLSVLASLRGLVHTLPSRSSTERSGRFFRGHFRLRHRSSSGPKRPWRSGAPTGPARRCPHFIDHRWAMTKSPSRRHRGPSPRRGKAVKVSCSRTFGMIRTRRTTGFAPKTMELECWPICHFS